VKAFLRQLSSPAEFFLIIALSFGLSIAVCLTWIVHHIGSEFMHPGNKDVMHLDNGGIATGAVVELITLGIVLWIGRIRGWSLQNFGLRTSWKWTGLGMLLFLGFQLVVRLIHFLIAGSLRITADAHGTPAFLRISHLTIPFIILISVVNPVFEEAIESGYFFHALQRYGMWITILAAAFFRGFLHVTMGFNGFITMFAMGLLYGFVYWRWRQLWPLIVAHSLQMFYALLPQALRS
jgi:membrane protease YdiL (CAAX protease family)